MNKWFLSASILTGFVTALHFFGGGREIADPLLEADSLPDTLKYLLYYCWHLVTMTLAVMTAAFFFAARSPKSVELAWFAGILAGLFSIWGIALVPAVGQDFAAMPQGWFFAPIAAFAIIGSRTGHPRVM